MRLYEVDLRGHLMLLKFKQQKSLVLNIGSKSLLYQIFLYTFILGVEEEGTVVYWPKCWTAALKSSNSNSANLFISFDRKKFKGKYSEIKAAVCIITSYFALLVTVDPESDISIILVYVTIIQQHTNVLLSYTFCIVFTSLIYINVY